MLVNQIRFFQFLFEPRGIDSDAVLTPERVVTALAVQTKLGEKCGLPPELGLHPRLRKTGLCLTVDDDRREGDTPSQPLHL